MTESKRWMLMIDGDPLPTPEAERVQTPRSLPHTDSVSVPREPTEAMRRAGCDAVYEWFGHPDFAETSLAIWHAMLDAAPRVAATTKDDK